MSQPSSVPDHADAPEWWRSAVIYQVYPRSFADSDGDGIGDLPGITARLQHLADLGVDALWLSPFYVSPMADAGYDVADYRDVDPIFGTLADAEKMIAEAKELGLRVIVDLVPNHTSDAHAWFRAALAAGPGSPERARYLFRDGVGDGPPNGWRSVFGGPAWTRVPDGQWYLHLFDSGQPDLDWSNPEVREEFHDILRTWLDRGVDGFRVDVANALVKADGLPEWEHEHGTVDAEHAPMWDQDGVHEIYRGWRAVLDTYDGDRMLVAEAWVEPIERLARYVRPDEMHQAFNFDFLKAAWRSADLRRVVTTSLAANDAVGAPTTWVLSNHDVVRHATRLALPAGENPNGIRATDPQPDAALGLRRARAASALMLALPGSAYVYQGEELGLPEHTTLPDELRQDPTWFRTGGVVAGRDGCRVPIPWNAAAPAHGFSPTGATWLPQPDHFAHHAVDVQSGDPHSTLELYRAALALRRDLRLGEGAVDWVDGEADALAFRNGPLLVVTNFGVDPIALPDGAEVLLASGELGGARQVPTDVTVWVRG
ncbi:alpha-amylase family glycosyl hydrolase [Pseudonocardia sp.]|uniref:glycoside hydrolase family 13 protein n=1 Tax=Pseudonocardia sp. TaxID=60912 RepID=UPI002624270E|nr:alpha-amylase family glycosyl hydrolase [Pseudonocardia sp.]